jgi:hypothetical protein
MRGDKVELPTVVAESQRPVRKLRRRPPLWILRGWSVAKCIPFLRKHKGKILMRWEFTNMIERWSRRARNMTRRQFTVLELTMTAFVRPRLAHEQIFKLC